MNVRVEAANELIHSLNGPRFLRVLCPVAQQLFGVLKRPWNDVDGDELADPAGRSRPGLGRDLDRADVAAHEHSHITIEKVFLADQDDIGSLEHGVRGFNGANKAACFDHPQGFHGVRTYQNPCVKAIDGTGRLSI